MLYQCEFQTTNRSLTIADDDVWVKDCYCNSESGEASVRLGRNGAAVRLTDNSFPDGIEHSGASRVLETGTSD